MIVSNMDSVEEIKVANPEAKDAFMKVLIGPEEGWADHVMREFELGKDGFSPKHVHDWPHINYIIEGRGELQVGDSVHEIKAGGYAYVPSGIVHQFRNMGQGRLKFICIVPKEGHK
ncbi:MAG TPA: cupin domain-containing protein [Clostridia bacterium]|nr:cupin domain-containing protein [Clostridia bacterium]